MLGEALAAPIQRLLGASQLDLDFSVAGQLTARRLS